MAPGENDATFVAVVEGRGTHQGRVAIRTNGKVLGEFPTGSRTWLDFTQELHESCCFIRDMPGRMLNGIGAAFLLLLNATGMVIWWPGIRNWKRALKVDFRRSWRRINWDLHSAAGFWTLLIAYFLGGERHLFRLAAAGFSIREFDFAGHQRASAGHQRRAGSDAPGRRIFAPVRRAHALDPGHKLAGSRSPIAAGRL